MNEIDWDIQEVKRLKKRQLIQFNFVVLLLFLLCVYLEETGKPFSLVLLFCFLSWIMTVYKLYELTTGKAFTKTSSRVLTFDRDRLGEKRWKRSTIIEIVVISICSILLTVFVSVTNFSDTRQELFILYPFIGAWIGSNIGEIVRISDL
ncbi:hypothetical protein GCM10028778_07330 [Barrientosiimonas marina]|uniref:Uncharacterized protein n=1 Tax=Lentibacillus kimchii TaxID=1542911 RepID=A0ABW2UUZ0_9BACI